MSTRRLNVEISGNSRGLEAALNRIDQGLGRTQSRVRGVNRDMNLWERQIAAIGTTARYALAGQFVFGITAAISRLGDFTNKLGQVAALSGKVTATGAYVAPSQGFLQGVGDAAILESNKVGVAVDDIQQYMTRFFSTFNPAPNMRMQEMTSFVDEVARLAAMLGGEAGDPQVLAGGVASLVNQIRTMPGQRGRTIGSVTNQVANLISQLVAETPNITGRDVAGQIGRMGQAMTQARMTPEQLFAVWTQAGKGGGSAAVIARGLSQLLGTSLLRPTTPGQKAAYASIGLPSDPNMLARMGGLQVLEKIMTRVGRGGRIHVRNRAALTNEDISDEDALAAAGVSGVDRTLLYNLFGRQESVRQFITLMSQDGVKGLNNMITAMKKVEEANTVRAREEAFQRQNALTRFNVSRQNLNLGLARSVQWPLENIVAPPVGYLSNEVTKHRTATQVALGALFGGLAIKKGWGLLKSLRPGGATPGQEMVSGLLATESLPNVLAGGATDGTRANPFWVIIHPDSWYVGTPGGRGMGGPGDKPPTGFWSKAKDYGKRVPPVIPFGLTAGGVAAGAATTAGAAIYGFTMYDFYRSRLGKGGALPVDFQQHMTPGQSLTKLLMEKGNLSWVLTKDIESAYHKRGIGDPVIVRMQADDVHQEFTIRLVDAQGHAIKIEQKKGAPMKFTVAPTYKGKSKANKNNTNAQVP